MIGLLLGGGRLLLGFTSLTFTGVRGIEYVEAGTLLVELKEEGVANKA